MNNLLEFVREDELEEGHLNRFDKPDESRLLETVSAAAPLLRLMKEEDGDYPDHSRIFLTGSQRNELADLVEELDVLQGIFEGTDDSGSDDASSNPSDPTLRGKLGFSARHFGAEPMEGTPATPEIVLSGVNSFGPRHSDNPKPRQPDETK